jgi:hypothetical protein
MDFSAAYGAYIGYPVKRGNAESLYRLNQTGWSKQKTPQVGDMHVMWYASGGTEYGHTGVVVEIIEGVGFYSIDQNWVNSSLTIGSPPYKVYHPLNNKVRGFLRPIFKSQTQGGTMFENDNQIQAMYYLLRGRKATAKEVAGWRGKKIIDFATNKYAKQEVADRVAYTEKLKVQLASVKTALANEKAKPPTEVVKEVIKVVKEPVEVPVEKIVYTHDDETSKKISAIYDYFVSRWQTFRDFIKK